MEPMNRRRSEEEILERGGLWAKAVLFDDDNARDLCRQRQIPLTRAANESVNTGGGFAVPSELEELILETRDLSGTYRGAVRLIQMGSDNRKTPKRGTGVSVFFSAEAQELTGASVVFDGVQLTAKKVTGLLVTSSELLDDAPIDIGAFLAEEFGEAIAGLQDTVGWTGDGSSTHGGMSGIATQIVDGTHAASAIAAAATHNTALTVDASDLGKLIGAVPERYLGTARFYASGYFIGNALARLGATSAGVVRTPSGPRPLMQFAGIPIEPVKELPGSGAQSGKAMVLLGDARFAATLGERRGLRLARTENRFMERDQIAFRVTSRFDANPHTLGDGAKAGPLVALVGTA